MSLEIQTRFSEALIDRDRPAPDGVTSWNGPRPERRFGVYRNNVAVGLIGALAARFPVAEKIVGEAFFAAMALEFIRRHPPRSPLLLAYGDDFADFVAGFEPAQPLEYLPDVIRLEAARSHAYHAEDAAPIDPSILAELDPGRLAELRFVMHPSFAVIRSSHPIVTIWAMNSGEAPLGAIEHWQAEDALVVRPAMIVHVHPLPPGGAAFLLALAAGEGLAAAVSAGMQETGTLDLAANLAGALQAGAFIAIAEPETDHE